MPSFKDHSGHCSHNLAFLDSFFLKRFNDWAVTVMFYASVHMVEAILDRDHSVHSLNHRERSANLAILDSFPNKAYKAMEREAHDSRYKRYSVYSWEIHRLFRDCFQKMVEWFNGQVEETQALNIQICKKLHDEWNKEYRANNADCNKCH
jgi:hypothetical protein